jgi:hypothetical protein
LFDPCRSFRRVSFICVEDNVAAVEQGPNAAVTQLSDKRAQVCHGHPVRPADVDTAQQRDVPLRQPAILCEAAPRPACWIMIRSVELDFSYPACIVKVFRRPVNQYSRGELPTGSRYPRFFFIHFLAFRK